MKRNIVKQILWPSSRQFTLDVENSNYWLILCILLVIPFTAIFHHLIFYRPTCMLNPFGTAYYLPSVLYAWLSRDPSLPWAIVTAITVYYSGKRYQVIKLFAAPIFVSFFPLSLWIWDIPFTGRFICHHFHDDKLLFWGYPMKTRYLYLLGMIIYILFFGKMIAEKMIKRGDR